MTTTEDVWHYHTSLSIPIYPYLCRMHGNVMSPLCPAYVLCVCSTCKVVALNHELDPLPHFLALP